MASAEGFRIRSHSSASTKFEDMQTAHLKVAERPRESIPIPQTSHSRPMLYKSATAMLSVVHEDAHQVSSSYRRCASNVEHLPFEDTSSQPSSIVSDENVTSNATIGQQAVINVVKSEDPASAVGVFVAHKKPEKSLSSSSVGSKRSVLSVDSPMKKGDLRVSNSASNLTEKPFSITVSDASSKNLRKAFTGVPDAEGHYSGPVRRDYSLKKTSKSHSASDLDRITESEAVKVTRAYDAAKSYHKSQSSYPFPVDDPLSSSRHGYHRMATWGYNRSRAKTSSFARGASFELPPPGFEEEAVLPHAAAQSAYPVAPAARNPPATMPMVHHPVYGPTVAGSDAAAFAVMPLTVAALYGYPGVLPGLDVASQAAWRNLHMAGAVPGGFISPFPDPHRPPLAYGPPVAGLMGYESDPGAYAMLSHLSSMQKQYWQQSSPLATPVDIHPQIMQVGSIKPYGVASTWGTPPPPVSQYQSPNAVERGNSRLIPPTVKNNSATGDEKRQTSNLSVASTSVPFGEDTLSPMGTALSHDSRKASDCSKVPSKDIAAAQKSEIQEDESTTVDIEKVPHSRIPDNLKTTVMLRNIPNNMTEARLVERLEEIGFGPDSYDFLHLPKDSRTKSNMGYAFINLVSAAVASSFKETCNGVKLGSDASNKICEVTFARIQGKTRNMKLHGKRDGNSKPKDGKTAKSNDWNQGQHWSTYNSSHGYYSGY